MHWPRMRRNRTVVYLTTGGKCNCNQVSQFLFAASCTTLCFLVSSCNCWDIASLKTRVPKKLTYPGICQPILASVNHNRNYRSCRFRARVFPQIEAPAVLRCYTNSHCRRRRMPKSGVRNSKSPCYGVQVVVSRLRSKLSYRSYR
jgi:hypothetical protein